MSAALYAAVAVAGLVIYGLGRAVLARIAAGGAAKARADRAEGDLAVAKKQGEILAEERTTDDVARRLDDGSF